MLMPGSSRFHFLSPLPPLRSTLNHTPARTLSHTAISDPCLPHRRELYFFKEFLAHYDSLIRALTRTISTGLLIAWHTLLFSVLWCSGDVYSATCTNSSYVQASNIAFKVLLCIFVATLASLIAAGVTKFISTHFYKSTHFKKLKEALEIEFQLRALSTPKKIAKKSYRMLPKISNMHLPNAKHSSNATLHRFGSKGKDVRTTTSRLGDGATVTSDGVVLDMPLDRHTISEIGSKSAGNSPNHSRSSSWDTYSLSGLERDNFDSDTSSVFGGSEPSLSHSELGEVQLTLDKDLLKALPIELLDQHEPEDIDEMSDAEIERIRTAVVIKTYSSLVRQHKYRTPEAIAEQLQSVRKFAASLFKNIRGPDAFRDYITLQDLRLFYTDDQPGRKKAYKAFKIFSSDPNAKVAKQEVIRQVEGLFVSRSEIAASLSDTETMMNSLEGGLAAFLHFLFIAVYLLIWGVDIMQGFSSFSATVLALSFIFGNSIRNTFEAMLFLFIQHPYDVGDWTNIDSEWLKVKKIGLLHTSFQNFYDHTVTFQNSALFGK
eukprot:CAMPEP_0117676600 /NCGR_PEP_ID=MMETSP0804-20121206/16262_1 /TAXON_ID=1074897 /ORGANISM="Tetraselmis astigmatica, Strain CCMP880" /LENGTH=544 /DNA_ID=CAMNT_0005485755 /DNA_START=98 /DNA_END=1730 /DNA_ORIENTATION=+